MVVNRLVRVCKRYRSTYRGDGAALVEGASTAGLAEDVLSLPRTTGRTAAKRSLICTSSVAAASPRALSCCRRASSSWRSRTSASHSSRSSWARSSCSSRVATAASSAAMSSQQWLSSTSAGTACDDVTVADERTARVGDGCAPAPAPARCRSSTRSSRRSLSLTSAALAVRSFATSERVHSSSSWARARSRRSWAFSTLRCSLRRAWRVSEYWVWVSSRGRVSRWAAGTTFAAPWRKTKSSRSSSEGKPRTLTSAVRRSSRSGHGSRLVSRRRGLHQAGTRTDL
ncbi:hypothetical protein DMC30DRAFT_295332 [Rhodotorula diobovata]|uniref:Uncharacterized protein n=1 Tax=Rhodotorula diobovata TaxID=5288 RepID=A0A5C5G398_9BASI|nr:hypothetical protein DMC30DRAFT_295332 [Rhodotorula diobovata]